MLRKSLYYIFWIKWGWYNWQQLVLDMHYNIREKDLFVENMRQNSNRHSVLIHMPEARNHMCLSGMKLKCTLHLWYIRVTNQKWVDREIILFVPWYSKSPRWTNNISQRSLKLNVDTHLNTRSFSQLRTRHSRLVYLANLKEGCSW